MKYFLIIVTSFFIGFSTAPICAQVRLPQLIRDSMILQRDVPVNIWGWAAANEKVQVKFNGKAYKTKANAGGDWKIQLPATKAGGPYTMEVSGKNKINLKEILFGDVWFCSGQSNMVHQMNIHDVTYANDIANANDPDIRQFWVPTLTNLEGPQTDIPAGYWQAAVGEDVRPFSAVAYFFAKKIHKQYNIPIGIINASVGGTAIESWMSEDGFKDFENILSTIKRNKDTAYLNSLTRRMPTTNTPRPAPPVDAGMEGETKWFDVNYTLKGWRNINVPGFWEDQGLKDLNGIVWYRKEVEVPASMTGKAAKVFLGRIVDADELYINGKRVGSTGYQYPQRRYQVPADVLKAGKNIFVVRITNTGGKGGFVPDKPYCVFAGKDTVDLKGEWQYKVGVAYKPVERGFGGGGGGGINAQAQPTSLYNAMVAHAINYSIKGFCWYQGETNAGKAEEYKKLMPALIRDWRNKWQQGNLPFLSVQLPGYMDFIYHPTESQWASMREAQLQSLQVPNTGLAVAIDLGEWNDIHPDNKKDVGERLALAALKVAYNQDIVYSGPIFQAASIESGKIKLTFSNIGGGLITNDDEALSEFAIAGADKKFVWAKAKIEGNKVIVWSDEISDPKYVRYAWADNPVNPNLYNKEGLPASPFRTDQ